MDAKFLFVLSLVSLTAAPASADVVDYLLNINGTTYCDQNSGASPCNTTLASGQTLNNVPSASSTLNESFGGTGLGTVSLTLNPGPGTYNVGFWLFENLAVPGDNEFGVSNGSPAAGESWQIDVPDYDYVSELGTAGAGSIIANTAANTLANTSYVPGNVSNYDQTSCGFFTGGAANPLCNDFASDALAYNFTLGANEQEVLTFTMSTTKPNGFYLEQIHPVDGNNASEIDYFFSATATTMPINTTTPEPGMWVPLAMLSVGLMGFVIRKRAFRN